MSEQQLHERLRELLGSAQASTCQVVATFLDIRGFTLFSARGDSFDAAAYLRAFYTNVLSFVFSDAAFFKPTGDGLLLIHELPHEETAVAEVISSILKRSVTLVQDFGHIADDDLMVNVDTPQQLGVGIARGSATRLVSGDSVLDYTGRCLNLAARLMDKARPSGVVFSDRHAARLMDDEIKLIFSSDRVCVRGIAEEEPLAICVTADVKISPADREPVPTSRNSWGTPTEMELEKVLRLTNFGFYLPRRPRAHESALVLVEVPEFNKDGSPEGSILTYTIPGTVEEEPNGSLVRIRFEDIHKSIKRTPKTYTSKFLWSTKIKPTEVTFTPFIAPDDEG